MNKGFTPAGQRALGELIRECRQSNEVHKQVVDWIKANNPLDPIPYQISQEQFVRWLTATSGINVSESAIGRLERGEGCSGPPLSVLIALCEMQVLRFPDGSFCDLNRVADILREEINPVNFESSRFFQEQNSRDQN